MSVAAATLPVGPGSKSRSEGENASPMPKGPSLGNGGKGPVSRIERQASTTHRSNDAREKLKAVGRGMSDGSIASREQVVAEETPINDPADVSDSGAIAPVKDPPAAPAKPKAEKPAAKPASKEPTAEEKAAADAKAKRIGAAKRALALDGWDPADIGDLKEDKLLAMGEHRAKNQADVNREFAKLRNAASGRNADGTFASPDPAAAAPAAEPKADDADSKVKKDREAKTAAQSRIDSLIESAKEDIGEPATKLLKSMAAIMREEYAAQAEVGRSVTTEMLYSKGYDVVAEAYPDQLEAKPESFDEVAENFQALVASGRYGKGQISKAWRDAAHMAYGQPKTVRKAQRDMLARQEAADVGRVDPGSGDTGATTDAPITNQRDALREAGRLMAANPTASPERLREAIMAKVRGRR